MESPPQRAARARPPVDVGSESLEVFLAGLASAAPAPGGGAAAALVAGLAAALTGMVCRITVSRDPSAASLVTVTASADALRQQAIDLVREDSEAYRRVIAARREAGDALRLALVRAIEVPLELVRRCRDLLALCEAAAPWARLSTLGDLRVAVALAWGALEAASLLARVNLKELMDVALAATFGNDLDNLMAQAEALRHRASSLIAERMGPLV